MSKTTKNFKQTAIKYKWLILGVLIALLLIEVFITGYTKFLYNVAKCGQVPVAVISPVIFNFTIGDSQGVYNTPGNYVPNANTLYYCTEADAQNDGIQKDPLQGS